MRPAHNTHGQCFCDECVARRVATDNYIPMTATEVGERMRVAPQPFADRGDREKLFAQLDRITELLEDILEANQGPRGSFTVEEQWR